MKDANEIDLGLAEAMANTVASEKAKYVSEPFDGTPFMFVKGLEGWNLCIGKYRMWEEFETTKEGLLEKLEDRKWEMIAKIAGIIAEMAISNFLKDKV